MICKVTSVTKVGIIIKSSETKAVIYVATAANILVDILIPNHSVHLIVKLQNFPYTCSYIIIIIIIILCD